MSVFVIVVIAILVAVSTFGLNQVMLVAQDVKLIKAVVTELKTPKKEQVPPPPAADDVQGPDEESK